ncbi:hypothetical protein ABIA30_001955 [Mycobacterium sp. MAA66]|jgi:hypothetical protein|uniref:DUF2505 domain-containing protein n=1 Tax=Mycobacterium sp. MAA66 TaxID=3156297 RepID=UPI003513A1A3
MPRSFDMAADYGATVEQVYRTFCSKDFWLARLAESGADIWSLDSVSDDGAGGLDFISTQTMRAPGLPAVVTQLHRGDLSAIREEHWGPVVQGQALGTIRARIPGAPVSISGSAVLGPCGSGARLQMTSTVEVRIPLLGGKVESMIGQHMIHLLRLEADFTMAYLSPRLSK